VVLATEMATDPPNSPAPEAPVCTGGDVPVDLFADDMENTGSANWVVQGGSSASRWGYISGYAHSGVLSLYAPNTAAMADTRLSHPVDVVLPAGAHLWFAHAFDTQAGAPPNASDGGVIEYSTNGGSNWSDAGSLISENGYTRTINSASNPLNGRQAFAAVSNGYRSTRLDLSSLAGQSVRFGWRFGSNSGGGDLGWLLDDVHLYTCETPTPGLSISKSADQTSVVAGQAIDYHVTVTNTGNVDLTNVVVSDPDAPDCAEDIGALDPGDPAVVIDCSYTTQVADIGTYSNTASVDSDQTSPTPSNQVDVTVLTNATCNGHAVTVDLAHGGTPTAGNDVILGTPGPDTVFALGGNDRVCGVGGNDTIEGGPGGDVLLGGGANDTVKGQGANDTVDGGAGNDTLLGGAANDSLFGRGGADHLNGGADHDTCNGGAQIDTATACEVRSQIP
jgi:Ca2+-binding RTX toxin-like protein